MTARTLSTGRVATPERWQEAAQRAQRHGVEVRRLDGAYQKGTENWIATSISDPNRAHLLQVRDGIVVSCGCEAARFGDPVCHHRAAFYLFKGTLVVPEPELVSV